LSTAHAKKIMTKGCYLSFYAEANTIWNKQKKKLELYFTVKAAMPDLFENRDPERKDVLEAINYCHNILMPRLTPQGYRVSIFRMTTNDISKFKIDLQILRGSMHACIRTAHEYPIAGDVMIFDAQNITAAHGTVFLTPLVKRALIDGPEAYPNRLRQIHVVNAFPIIERIVSIIKSLLKEKIRKRFFIHSKPEELLNYIPAVCLPKEYGGSTGTLSDMSAKTHEYVRAHAHWLKDQETVIATGPIPEKYKTDDFGGPEGSFRKLALD